jgi:hypothetical protein
MKLHEAILGAFSAVLLVIIISLSVKLIDERRKNRALEAQLEEANAFIASVSQRIARLNNADSGSVTNHGRELRYGQQNTSREGSESSSTVTR